MKFRFLLLCEALLALPYSGYAWAAVKPVDAKPDFAILARKGCLQCHAGLGLGLHGGSGLDLSQMANSVPRHYHESLAAFMKAPQGPMKNVLGKMVHLTPAERDAIVHLLQSASPAPKPASK